MHKKILIDLTRLLERALEEIHPTGVDRVSIAYVKYYGCNARVLFRKWGHWFVFSQNLSNTLIEILSADKRPSGRLVYLLLIRGILLCRFQARHIKGGLLLNIDHSGLDGEGYSKKVKHFGLKPVYLLHDLIPITHPEYCRLGEKDKHIRRIRTMLETASGIITNSSDTFLSLKKFARNYDYKLPATVVAPLGISKPKSDFSANSLGHNCFSRPYFVMLSTIEPRKNHWLIFQIWKKLYQEMRDRVPLLLVIGRRGWENQNTFAILDRSPELKKCIVELNSCDDYELVGHLKSAKALLFPSFAEGYGLPLIEALQLQVPVIASNLQVFREVAGDIPEYINPLDGETWEKVILDYLNNESEKRLSQLDKLKKFNAPTWKEHFDIADRFVNDLTTVSYA